MYDALYLPLPDCAAYARRIGMPWPLTPDLTTLDDILYHHQCTVPFENLEVFEEKKTPSLEIPALYRKVVEQNRGGYCFELNALLCAFLQQAGYDARSVSCRVILGRNFVPPMLHRGILVELQGVLYYCDVGFGGPQPAGAVPLGGQREIRGETFFCEKREEDWWSLDRITSRGDRETVLEFLLHPMSASHFVPYNFYCANSPDSVFTQKRMLNLRTETGSLAMTNNILTEHRSGETIVTQIGSAGEVAALTEKLFKIHIST